MKKSRLFGCFLCVAAFACEVEADVLADVDSQVFEDDERPVFIGGDAADDAAGCEVLKAFVANRYTFGDKPAWWAIDFSACGPDPEPRLLVWESGDGYVCEQEYDPVGMECEIILMEDCPKVADDMWHVTMWAAGADSFSFGYESLILDPVEDYTPDSIIPCKSFDVDGVLFWDCTGLPEQLPACDPVTVG